MPFTAYWVLLTISGVLLLAMAGTGYGQRTPGQRAINAVFGLGYIAYGLYLGFIFKTGLVHIFIYAFVVPVLLVVNGVRNANARKAAGQARSQMTMQPASPAPNPVPNPAASESAPPSA